MHLHIGAGGGAAAHVAIGTRQQPHTLVEHCKLGGGTFKRDGHLQRTHIQRGIVVSREPRSCTREGPDNSDKCPALSRLA